MVSSLKDRYFNPRTPVGCDHTSTWMVSVVSVFQSTHPSGVRRLASALRGTAARFQSTHPSGVRHLQLSHLTYRFEISIHAPQWGATNTRLSALPCLGHFNPRTPVGCDRVRSSLGSSQSGFQSTHPSGVRLPSDYQSSYRSSFQSTHPSGVRRDYSRRWRVRYDFNPRTPVGCDRRHGHVPVGRGYFNPRTPVGCDYR